MGFRIRGTCAMKGFIKENMMLKSTTSKKFTYLCVLVYEGEGIGHIVVAKVDYARSNPRAELLLRTVENLVHVFPYGRCRLHPVQPLPSVPEGVIVVKVGGPTKNW